MNYLDLTLEEMMQAIDNNQITAEELVKESIERSKKWQPIINPFVTLLEEPKINKKGMLKGIPFGLKDNFSTKGILTTSSSNILKDYVPFFNATCVEKLYNEGATLIGKTVLDELAIGGTGTTGHTGSVKNPWNKNRLIGGSSAGSAAIVAAGIVPFSIGSDTGDSIRKPAAYGGIVGFKPTYGRISRYGLFSFASSLDHVGCFTRSVKDVSYIVDIMKGKDKYDMTSLDNDNLLYSEKMDKNVKGKKLFYIKEILDINNYENEVDDELVGILDNFKDTVQKCKDLGMTVDEISINKELISAIYPAYITISCAEATSNNSNLTGIIFGPRAEGKSIDEIMFSARTEGFSELIKRRFILGSYILQKENQEKLFLNAGRIRRMLVEQITELFKEYDGLILPAQGSVAPEFGSDNIDRLSNKYLLLENHMAIGNFGGFPSITIPCGFVKNMPIGLSITSGIKKDLELLNIAYGVEDVLGFKGQFSKGEI